MAMAIIYMIMTMTMTMIMIMIMIMIMTSVTIINMLSVTQLLLSSDKNVALKLLNVAMMGLCMQQQARQV